MISQSSSFVYVCVCEWMCVEMWNWLLWWIFDGKLCLIIFFGLVFVGLATIRFTLDMIVLWMDNKITATNTCKITATTMRFLYTFNSFSLSISLCPFHPHHLVLIFACKAAISETEALTMIVIRSLFIFITNTLTHKHTEKQTKKNSATHKTISSSRVKENQSNSIWCIFSWYFCCPFSPASYCFLLFPFIL